MSKTKQYDLCVIGGGSAGLSVAAGAAQLGLETVLVEAGAMGGDCLNTGCIPSKALLASGKLIHSQRHPWLGVVPAHTFETDRAGVNSHVHGAIRTIAPHDSVERFEGLGVRVVQAHASFIDGGCIQAGDEVIAAKNFVVAAGSSAAIPKIPGLDREKVLTNETIFDVGVVPDHLVVIGGGPIGIEMAQAHRRLGSRVTVLDMMTILPKDEPELVEVVRRTLTAEGIDILENVSVTSISHEADRHKVTVVTDTREREIEGSHILVATGRKVNVEGLGLEKAGVEYNAKGIRTDARLRTSNRRIYAIGDIAGGPQFTHIAGYHAGIVIRNLAFRLPAKVDYRALPWVTFTDPELAHVGLTLDAARKEHGDHVESLVHPFKGLDRAVAEGRNEGLLKVVAGKGGKILGCSIVAPGAGELIGLWVLAIAKGMKLRDLTGLILPYPTFSEISKQAASEWYKPSLFSDRTRQIVRLLQKLPAF
ncbi:MAG: FAD-dependent oxidoreductase [Pseudaminobacter sp.]|nr:FAD-dependent oxidoreductase [Pseudaminobacter sp.]